VQSFHEAWRPVEDVGPVDYVEHDEHGGENHAGNLVYGTCTIHALEGLEARENPVLLLVDRLGLKYDVNIKH